MKKCAASHRLSCATSCSILWVHQLSKMTFQALEKLPSQLGHHDENVLRALIASLAVIVWLQNTA